MNMLKKGPDIKLSALRVPDALLDLYYDLRMRRLLPLVALLVVAIVAVPIALRQSSESKGLSALVPTPSATASQTNELVVTKAAPGLRDYHRRLDHLREKDPFKQQYASPESSGEGASASSVTAGEAGTGSSSAATPITGSPSSESGSTTVTTTHHLVYLSYAIDARVVPVKTQNNGHEAKPQVRHNLPELTALPSRRTPAVIFMGVSGEGKEALLLLSSQVEAIVGGGTCLLGSEPCQLLALKPGVPETFVYGPQGRTFKIELLRIHLISSKKQRRAPLGKRSGHTSEGRARHRLIENIPAPASRAIEAPGPDPTR